MPLLSRVWKTVTLRSRGNGFDVLEQDSAYQIASAPCFETYLNNGMEDGYWDIEMYIPVQRK